MINFSFLVYKQIKIKKMLFNYFLICCTNGCKVGEKFMISSDSYDNNGGCLLKNKEKRVFLCKNCCEINFITFELIINKETLKFIKKIEIEKKHYKLLEELKKFEIN